MLTKMTKMVDDDDIHWLLPTTEETLLHFYRFYSTQHYSSADTGADQDDLIRVNIVIWMVLMTMMTNLIDYDDNLRVLPSNDLELQGASNDIELKPHLEPARPSALMVSQRLIIIMRIMWTR